MKITKNKVTSRKEYSLSMMKAKKIIKEGMVFGKKLTPKQKRYMGWVAGGKK